MWIEDILVFLKKFEGSDTQYLYEQYNVNPNAKSKNYILIRRIMDDFEGSSVLDVRLRSEHVNVKTIQLNKKGKTKEAMSFAPINFMDIINETWDESVFKKYLLNDFLFFVFRETDQSNILERIILWRVPEAHLEGEIKRVWEDTKNKIQNGDIIREVKNGKVITTFANELSTKICHVRPHGSNGTDVARLPVPDVRTGYKAVVKQSFWFNHDYINEIVNYRGE